MSKLTGRVILDARRPILRRGTAPTARLQLQTLENSRRGRIAAISGVYRGFRPNRVLRGISHLTNRSVRGVPESATHRDRLAEGRPAAIAAVHVQGVILDPVDLRV